MRQFATAVPIVIVSAVVAAFLGPAGADVLLVGLILGGLVAWRAHRRALRMSVIDWVERHSFPNDTIEDLATRELGRRSIAEVRELQEAWRQGMVDARWRERLRRSEAARRAAARRPAR